MSFAVEASHGLRLKKNYSVRIVKSPKKFYIALTIHYRDSATIVQLAHALPYFLFA